MQQPYYIPFSRERPLLQGHKAYETHCRDSRLFPHNDQRNYNRDVQSYPHNEQRKYNRDVHSYPHDEQRNYDRDFQSYPHVKRNYDNDIHSYPLNDQRNYDRPVKPYPCNEHRNYGRDVQSYPYKEQRNYDGDGQSYPPQNEQRDYVRDVQSYNEKRDYDRDTQSYPHLDQNNDNGIHLYPHNEQRTCERDIQSYSHNDERNCLKDSRSFPHNEQRRTNLRGRYKNRGKQPRHRWSESNNHNDDNDNCSPTDELERDLPNAHTPSAKPRCGKKKPPQDCNAGKDGTQETNENCRCEPCKQDFTSQKALQQHTSSHRRCEEDDCDYVASAKALQLHFVQEHQEGKFRIILDTPEDIEKWREERRRNWPTEENIAAKKQKLAADKEDGILVQTKEFVYRERSTDRGRGRGRGRRGRGRGRWNNALQVKDAPRNHRYRRGEHNRDNEEGSDPFLESPAQVDKENDGIISEEKNTSELLGENSDDRSKINTVNRDSNQTDTLVSDPTSSCTGTLRTEIDNNEPKGGRECVPSTCDNSGDCTPSALQENKELECSGIEEKNSDNVGGENLCIANVLSNCPDADITNTSAASDVIHFQFDNSDDIPATELSKKAEVDVSSEAGVAYEKEDGELDDDEDCCGEGSKESSKEIDSNVRERPVMTEITNDVQKLSEVLDNVEKGSTETEHEKPKVNHRSKRKSRNTEEIPPTETKVSLLEMLLAGEIRHERNVILQCVRYIVKKNFFETT